MPNKQVATDDSEKILVSFIVTTYNLPVELLRECLDSIMALSLKPSQREIIVVDDGSDTSPIHDLLDICDMIVYIRQRNLGLSEARNTGLRHARGIYIQFVDGDDCLNVVPYEQCLDIVRFSKPDMVMFDFSRSPDKKLVVDAVGPVSGAAYMHNHNIHVMAWGYIFRRAILGNLRFVPGIYHEDEDFTPQLILRAETLYVSASKAYMYRLRGNSITTRRNLRHDVKRLDDCLNTLFKLADIAETMPSECCIALRRRVAQLTMDYIYGVMKVFKSQSYLEKKIEVLTAHGLFPLPDRKYTRKYDWFRKATSTKMGRLFLLRTLQFMK